MKLVREIIVTLGGKEVELHPSLRHAMRLEAEPGGLKGLLEDIAGGSLTAAITILAPFHPSPMLPNRIHDAGLDNLLGPLVEFILACAGASDDPRPDQGEPMPLGEYLTHLYRIGTGWLGWTPDTTLDATPTEIVEAYQGRVDLLKAIFGTSEPEKPADLGAKVSGFFARAMAAQNAKRAKE